MPRLDLTTLAQVRVRVGPWTRVGLRRVEKATTFVLTDRSGRTAEIIDALWEDPRPLVLAVAAWAARTGAALDEDALRHLTAGTPTAFGIGRSSGDRLAGARPAGTGPAATHRGPRACQLLPEVMYGEAYPLAEQQERRKAIRSPNTDHSDLRHIRR